MYKILCVNKLLKLGLSKLDIWCLQAKFPSCQGNRGLLCVKPCMHGYTGGRYV